MKRILSVVALLSVVCAGPVAAETLTCSLKQVHSSGGWIPIKTQITYDPDEEGAVVRFSLGKSKVVQDGTMETLNAKRVTFLFNVKGLVSKTNQYLPTMQYRATYMFKNDAYRVHAKPLGYANSFRANGKCTKD